MSTEPNQIQMLREMDDAAVQSFADYQHACVEVKFQRGLYNQDAEKHGDAFKKACTWHRNAEACARENILRLRGALDVLGLSGLTVLDNMAMSDEDSSGVIERNA
jgi:hypothetical protein